MILCIITIYTQGPCLKSADYFFSTSRRLFPTVQVTITGLIPSVMYNVKIRFVCFDKYRHKYSNGNWSLLGESEIIHDEPRMELLHSSSPSSGEIWMKKPVNFNIKISHYKDSKGGNVSDNF